jgi:hypothetical protein
VGIGPFTWSQSISPLGGGEDGVSGLGELLFGAGDPGITSGRSLHCTPSGVIRVFGQGLELELGLADAEAEDSGETEAEAVDEDAARGCERT